MINQLHHQDAHARFHRRELVHPMGNLAASVENFSIQTLLAELQLKNDQYWSGQLY